MYYTLNKKKSLLDISQMMLGYLLHGLYVYIGLSLNFFFFGESVSV